MIFIHTLRMMSDLSVYFFIAELVVISMGGQSQFVPFLLLGACYGMMVYLQSRQTGKLYLLLPAVVLLLPAANLPALLLPIGYILYLVHNELTILSWDRQSELFSLCVKFFPLVSIPICFLGKYKILIQYSLPMAFISLATSIFLMRMLRQPPSVHLDPVYQRKNGVVFVTVLFMAWLFSREFMFRIMAEFMSFVYMKAIYPVLNCFIMLFMGVLKLIMALFSWFKFGEVRFTENHLGSGEMGPSFKDAVIEGGYVATTETLLTAVVIILLLACAFYFFRWLALHKGEETFITTGFDIIRGKETARVKKERATTTVLQVRKQYRIFLKLYKEHGGKIETAFTSEDVLENSKDILEEDSADILAEMRRIYISARYGGMATKTDLKRMKQINKELAMKN